MKGIVINEIGKEEHALISTAIDDYSMRHINDGEIILHLFQHTGINMGHDDTKIDDFSKGLAYYRSQGYDVTIRNSGGRSVVSDSGVLNMSLIVKSDAGMYENFEYLDQFIRSALAPLTQEIETGEVSGAYCPGKSDMSIHGKKFCGTAQRKRRDVSALVCYIGVNGNQTHRSQIVKGFYDSMSDHAIEINPSSMGTLSSLIGREVSIKEVSELMIKELMRRTESIEHVDFIDTTSDDFKDSLEAARIKNKIVNSN